MKIPKLQTVVMVLGALLAVNLLIAAGSQSSKDDGPELPSAIERLIPPRGNLIRLQDDVGVDLDNAYKGRLVINRVVIPDDEVIWIPSLGKLTFRPGEDGHVLQGAESGGRSHGPGALHATNLTVRNPPRRRCGRGAG